jgi:hypothetical protein
LTTYPNPVSESATVSFNLEKDSKTSINVYSLQGQHIATLVDQNLKAGKHQVNWSPNGTLSNGVYLMKINIGGQMFTKKLAIQR